jgi:predicted DNA-binding protein
MSKQAPKKKTSFSISKEAEYLLDRLADKDSRTKSQMVEVLIKRAANELGIASE